MCIFAAINFVLYLFATFTFTESPRFAIPSCATLPGTYVKESKTPFAIHGGDKGIKGQRITFPRSSSCGVSTPWTGTRSPVKLLVCVNGRFTPLMCDMAAGPLCTRSFFFAARTSTLPAAATASSIRRDGKSSSCCLSRERTESGSVIG